MIDCPVSRWEQHKSSLHNLDFEDFKLRGSNSESVMLDVRTKEEYDHGHIKNAVNLDYLSPILAEELLGLDPDKSYYVYCRTGRRSIRVCMLLKNSGYEVFNLEAGIKDIPMDILVSI